MTCAKLSSDGIIGWRGWPFINFFITLVAIGYLAYAVYKKLKDSDAVLIPDLM